MNKFCLPTLVAGALLLSACGSSSASDEPTGDFADLRDDTRRTILNEDGSPMQPGLHPSAYVLEGQRWNKTIVTWSMIGSDGASDPRFFTSTQTAFNAWDSITKTLDFQYVANNGSADILVRRDDTLPAGVAGRTDLKYYASGSFVQNDVHIKLTELAATHDNFLTAVVMHEVGHAIGMDHSTLTTANMKAVINIVNNYPYFNYLIEEDIQGAQSLYGATNPDIYRYMPWPWVVRGVSPSRTNQYNQWGFADSDISKFRSSAQRLTVTCDKGSIGCK